ncbi:hypothetical protein ACVPOR_10240 [Staphylococcus aureus]
MLKGSENRKNDIVQAITDELGIPYSLSERVRFFNGFIQLLAARDALDNYEFEERRGDDLVVKEAIGVSGLITP